MNTIIINNNKTEGLFGSVFGETQEEELYEFSSADATETFLHELLQTARSTDSAAQVKC